MGRVLALVAGLLLVVAAPARAGGWWSYVHVDRRTIALGETVHVRAEAWFPTEAAAATAAEDDWYLYLLRGLDRELVTRTSAAPPPRRRWSIGDADAIRVGRIAFSGPSSKLGWVRASFRLPNVEPGTYTLMLCDLGCLRPFASVVPTSGLTIVADPALARAADRIDRLEQNLHRVAARQAEARRQARVRAAGAASAREGADRALVRIERRVGALEAEPDASVWAPAGWFGFGVLFGGVAAALVVRRIRRPGTPATLPPEVTGLSRVLARQDPRASPGRRRGGRAARRPES